MTSRQNVIRNLFGGEDMENYLTDLINDLMPNYVEPNPSAGPSTNRPNENVYVSRILREIMSEYNANIRNYQENTRICLEIIDSLEHHNATYRRTVYENQNQSRNFTQTPQPQPVYTNLFQTNQRQQPTTGTDNIWNRLYTYPIINAPRETILGRTIRARATIPTNLQDVIVRPTYEEVYNATADIMFSRNNLNLNTSCPITLDEFREGDLLTQIRRCGHLFNQHAIQNWFSRNVRCPVCRYDIRTRIPVDNSGNEDTIINDLSANYNPVNNNNNTEEYISSDGESDSDDNSQIGEQSRSDTEEVENLLSTITNNISNIIQNYVNNNENITNDNNNNIVTTSIYTFEIRGDVPNTTTDEEKTDDP